MIITFIIKYKYLFKISLMEKKDFIKIINEEISNFDFLGNDANTKEEEAYDLLKNEDFQKQFICDSLINNKKISTKISDANIGGNWDDEDATNLTIDYFIDIEYKYDPNKEPIEFGIHFYSEHVGIDIRNNNDNGDYNTTPTSDSYYTYINWSDIDVTLFSTGGDRIVFKALSAAPLKIQVLFIRNYCEVLINNKTTSTNKLKKDNVQNIPYC